MNRIYVLARVSIKVLKYLLPLLILLFIIYVFYIKMTQQRVEKTIEDITYITNGISKRMHMTNFKDFNADSVAYYDILPIDMKTKDTQKGKQIYNRFRTKLNFFESFKTKDERGFYFMLMQNGTLKDQYKGLSAYIISFPKVRRYECIALSRVNWKMYIPRFIAMEASYLNKDHPYNGIENLHYYTTIDNEGDEQKDTRDEGIVSRRPMDYITASSACLCLLHNCTFALKFY